MDLCIGTHWPHRLSLGRGEVLCVEGEVVADMLILLVRYVGVGRMALATALLYIVLGLHRIVVLRWDSEVS
jgi:hypothetical protein